MRTTLWRAERVLRVFLVIGTGALLWDGVAFGGPQTESAEAGGKTELPAIVVLRLKDTTVLSATAPNAFRSGTTCDSDGDVFLQLAYYDFAHGEIHSDSGISEIIPDEKRIVEYGKSLLPLGDYPNARLSRFNVTSSGSVYALIFTRRSPSDEEPRPQPEYYVERFKDDGTRDSITHIQAPPGSEHWFAQLMAAFPNGNFLIAGQSSASAGRPSAGSWQPFTGIYDASGRFIREVTLPEDVVNDFAEDGGGASQQGAGTKPEVPMGAAPGLPGRTGAPKTEGQAATRTSPAQPSKPKVRWSVAISTGGLVSGPDGNVWILRASDPIRLYAVDAGGQVIHHFQFSSPVAGLKPTEFGFAGPGSIFLQFAHFAGEPAASSGPSRLAAVFSILSERFEELYVLPETEKRARILACGDGSGGLLYIGGTSDNHLAVFDYGR